MPIDRTLLQRGRITKMENHTHTHTTHTHTHTHTHTEIPVGEVAYVRHYDIIQ